MPAADLLPALLGGIASAYAVLRTRQAHQLRTALDDARHRATHDHLTGLPNRAALTEAWPDLARRGANVALIDLDRFKPINDRYGHAAGDAVLVEVGRRLAGSVRDGYAARLGGDEFAVALLDDPAGAVRQLAAFLAAPIHLSGQGTVTVAASIGLAAPGETDLSAALAQADAAMYRAKATRRAAASRGRRSHVTARPSFLTRGLAHACTAEITFAAGPTS